MIKVIHVISDSNIGGAGRYLLTYLKNCDTASFEMSVALPEGSLLKPEIDALGFTVYEIADMAEQSFSRSAIGKLRSLFKKTKPDIVHTHASLSGRIAARLSGVKTIVYTRHSVFPPDKRLTTPLARLIHGFADRFLSTGIIAVAAAAQKNVTDTGIDKSKTTVIYNGVDKPPMLDNNEKRAVRERFGIPEGYRVAAIIARLTEVKGQRYFIDAAEAASLSGEKIKFIIAGVGEEEKALKQYCSDKLLDDTVIFAGFLDKVYELENIMDVQVNASFGTEAASLSLLEGMSLGVPAVVTDFGGNPEIIIDSVNGFVVGQKSGNAISDGIRKLFGDEKLYAEISECSKRLYEQKFTSQAMAKNMESYYLQLAGGRKEG